MKYDFKKTLINEKEKIKFTISTKTLEMLKTGIMHQVHKPRKQKRVPK